VLPLLGCLLACLLVGFAIFVLGLYMVEPPRISLGPHPAHRPGIWFMSHRADAQRLFPIQHMFFRLTPRDPLWAARHGDIFSHRDGQGAAFATLGAGPVLGKLCAAFNRSWDHEVPLSFEESAGDVGIDEENRRLEMILEAVRAYPNALPFSTWRPFTGFGYNCNALMAAFAARAGLDLPKFSRTYFLCQGVNDPVPEHFLKS
jgi:hypothetical protein